MAVSSSYSSGLYVEFDTFADGTLGSPAPNVPQAIIHWVVEDLIKYRDSASTVTTTCVFDYGLRNIEEGEEEEALKPPTDTKGKGKQRTPVPKPPFPSLFPLNSKPLNIANQKAALLNDAFLHIWDVTDKKANLLSIKGEPCYQTKF
jgi:hypothetical protein